MGSSSKQTTGYKYFSNFLLFIGNPIEKLLGINFDKRGWLHPFVDENGNALSEGIVNSPNLYGENEGGVVGKVHAKYGAANPTALQFYSDYLAVNDLPPLAYPFQSYLAFEDFYLGNSGYMKEMLLWPQRIHVRNDDREQWYDDRAEIPDQNGEEIEQIEARYSDLYNFSTEINGTELQEIDRYAVRRFSFDRNSGSIKLGIGFIYDSIEDQVFSVLIQSTSGPGKYLESDGFKLIRTEILSDDDYWSSRKIYHFRIPKGAPGMRSALFSVSFSGNYTDLMKLSEAYVEINQPQLPDSGMLISSISSLDINPVHKIREILTDDTAMNKPESDVNDLNFMKAADRIYDECLGISWAITEKSCLDAINELCGHIEAGVRVNRQTGLYEMVLFRDDWFSDDEIHSLAVNKIKSMSLEVANADETINQLNVSYYNRDAIKDSSFSVAENASIRNLNGRVNAEDADFPYFMNQRNAAVVAQWKLKQMSSPVWSGSFTTAAYEARKWNRYDLLKLAWPRKWQGTITVRIMKINLGTGTDVSIDFVEVVQYSSELSSNIVIDTPIDVAPLPPQACQYEPFELPYYLAVMALGQRQVDDELAYENNYGLVGVVAEKPQNNSLYAVMMTQSGTEDEEWLRAATIDYEPAGELDQSISKTSISFTVKNSTAIANVAAGTLIKCGSDWIGIPGEWMVFQSVDLDTSVVSVKRGALDSLPQAWGMNTKLYFCDNDVAYDQTEYIAGEDVLVAALTSTPSGLQELKGSIAIQMKARAFRPYPPANVKINGEYWPEEIETDLVLTWVDRNRVQQTGGEILSWFDGGVTIEPGTQTHLILTQLDEHNHAIATTNVNVTGAASYTMPISSMQADARTIAIVLKTLRDGFECLNPFFHTVELSQFFSAPYDLTVEFKND
jgi:hypothetical protein